MLLHGEPPLSDRFSRAPDNSSPRLVPKGVWLLNRMDDLVDIVDIAALEDGTDGRSRRRFWRRGTDETDIILKGLTKHNIGAQDARPFQGSCSSKNDK